MEKLPTRQQANTDITTAPSVNGSLLALSNGVSLSSLIREASELERLNEQLVLCRLRWRDAKKTMERSQQQGEELKKQIAALTAEKTKLDNADFMQIGSMVAEVCKQLNVNNNMREAQIDALVGDILELYADLKIKELAFIFRQGIIGAYGKTEFRLDAQVFHGWIIEYIRRRDTQISANNNRRIEESEGWRDNTINAKRL